MTNDDKITKYTSTFRTCIYCNFLIICHLLVSTISKFFSIVPTSAVVIRFFINKAEIHTQVHSRTMSRQTPNSTCPQSEDTSWPGHIEIALIFPFALFVACSINVYATLFGLFFFFLSNLSSSMCSLCWFGLCQ